MTAPSCVPPQQTPGVTRHMAQPTDINRVSGRMVGRASGQIPPHIHSVVGPCCIQCMAQEGGLAEVGPCCIQCMAQEGGLAEVGPCCIQCMAQEGGLADASGKSGWIATPPWAGM